MPNTCVLFAILTFKVHSVFKKKKKFHFQFVFLRILAVAVILLEMYGCLVPGANSTNTEVQYL